MLVDSLLRVVFSRSTRPVGELVITQSMLAQRSSELDPVNHGDLITSMGQLQRNARDLQE